MRRSSTAGSERGTHDVGSRVLFTITVVVIVIGLAYFLVVGLLGR
ncbi:hypothetical protein ABGB17_21100 [Sphaerisporangium sp. B11E5]